MPLDKRMGKVWTRLKIRLANLERASEARERAIMQLAEELGVEVDLTPLPTPEEEYAAKMVGMSSKHLLRTREVQEFLREAGEDRNR